jgi:hypothetical protein
MKDKIRVNIELECFVDTESIMSLIQDIRYTSSKSNQVNDLFKVISNNKSLILVQTEHNIAPIESVNLKVKEFTTYKHDKP